VNNAPEYQYSTNGGSSWSRQNGWTPAEANGKLATFFGYMFGDTVYGVYSGTNYGLRIAKMFQTTRVIACDTITANGHSSVGSRSAVNRRIGDGSANDSLVVGHIGVTQWRFYGEVSAGRLTQGVTWAEDPDSAHFSNASVFQFNIYYGVAVFNVNVQDIFFHDGTLLDTISQSIIPAPDGAAPLDAANTCVLARSPADSVLYIAFQVARRLYFYRGYINTVSKTWARTDSVVIADTNGTPNIANGLIAARCPTLSKQGSKLFYFYKLWADSSDKDNCSIVYETSIDEGVNWSTPTEFRAATGADTILMLTSPPYLNDDSYDIIGTAWTNNNAAGWVLTFRGDTLQAQEPPPPSAIPDYIQSRSGSGMIQSKSGGSRIQKK
jgi:hypothetical protein